MVICLELGADLHMAQLMPLSLTVSCFSKIQIGFVFLVPAHPGGPGKRAVKRVCVCDCRHSDSAGGCGGRAGNAVMSTCLLLLYFIMSAKTARYFYKYILKLS